MIRLLSALIAVSAIAVAAQNASAQYYVPNFVPTYGYTYSAPPVYYYYPPPRYEYYRRAYRYRRPVVNVPVYVVPQRTTTIRSTTTETRPQVTHPSHYFGDPHASHYFP